MVSINNVSSNSAVLASLRQIDKDLAQNQTRIGTGLKINSYSDNAALYTTAQSIRTNVKAQDALVAKMGLSKSRVDAATAGLSKLTDVLTKMAEVASSTTAGSSAADVSSATAKLAAYQTQITAIVSSSGFQGSNLLKGTVTETVSLTTDGTATSAYIGANIGTGDAVATMNTAVTAATTGTAIAALSTSINNALSQIVGLQASASGFSDLLGSQIEFQSTIKTINQSALSSIVDADMEQEAALTTALQVKQQLAYQALSIGNSSSQNILRLFQ
jgi:flagellin